MNIVERLQELQKFSNLSVRAFAIKCDLKQQTLDKQIKGISEPSANTLISIANAFPDISAEWLLRGEGEMLKPSTPNSVLGISLDTIESLNRAIKTKDENIEILVNRVKELENQLKNK